MPIALDRPMVFELENVTPAFRRHPDPAGLVRGALRWEWLRPPYKALAKSLWQDAHGGGNPDDAMLHLAVHSEKAIKMLGQCYTAATVYWYLACRSWNGYSLQRVQQIDDSGNPIHWWLRMDGKSVDDAIDPTHEQLTLLPNWVGYQRFRVRHTSRAESQGKHLMYMEDGSIWRLGRIEALVMAAVIEKLGLCNCIRPVSL